MRHWALAHPHECACLWLAHPWLPPPQDTIGPASRVTLVLASVVRDAAAAGALGGPFRTPWAPVLSATADAEARRLERAALQGVPDDAIIRALVAWTQLFGWVSFELFGHFAGVVENTGALFAQVVTDMCAFVGIRPSPEVSGGQVTA